MSDIHLDEVEVYSCCGICKQPAPARICDPKWVLFEEFLYSYCFVVFSFFLLFLLFPSFCTLFLFFFNGLYLIQHLIKNWFLFTVWKLC